MSIDVPEEYRARFCHIVKWDDFPGYGFNLHAERGKAGQFIGKVDSGSPAEAAGLREGDRIVEVNGVNIGNENHQQVVNRVRTGGEETRLLVVDTASDSWYKDQKIVIKGDMASIKYGTAERSGVQKGRTMFIFNDLITSWFKDFLRDPPLLTPTLSLSSKEKNNPNPTTMFS